MPHVSTAESWEPAIGSWVEEPRKRRSGGRTGIVVALETNKSGHVTKVQVLTVNLLLLASATPKLKTYEQTWFSLARVRHFPLSPAKLQKLDEQFLQAITPAEASGDLADEVAHDSITTNSTDGLVDDPGNQFSDDTAIAHGANLSVGEDANARNQRVGDTETSRGLDLSVGVAAKEEVGFKMKVSEADLPLDAIAKKAAHEAATSLNASIPNLEAHGHDLRAGEAAHEAVDDKAASTPCKERTKDTASHGCHQQDLAVVSHKRPKRSIRSDIIVLEAPEARCQHQGRSLEDVHSEGMGSEVFATPPKKRARRCANEMRCHVEVQWFHKSTAHRVAAMAGGRVSKQGLTLGDGGMVATRGLVRDVRISRATIVKAHKSFMNEGRATVVVQDKDDDTSCHRLLYVFISRAVVDDLAHLFDHLGAD